MSEQRFICGLGFPINSDDPIRIITDKENNKDYFKFSDICKIMNEQQDQISYWKHKVSSLLWILGQFDKKKVKRLLEEVEKDGFDINE